MDDASHGGAEEAAIAANATPGSGKAASSSTAVPFSQWLGQYRGRYLRAVAPPRQFLLKQREIISGFLPRFFVLRR